jgi:hypothetical protein
MTLSVPQADLVDENTSGLDSEVWARILKRLDASDPQQDQDERRRDSRYPFPRLMYLTPVDENGRTAAGDPIIAAGKDLSEGGLGFYHPEPLPSRRMIASMQTGNGHWLAFVVELTRSHRISEGWYQSSGHFVEPAVSPSETVEI